VAHQPAIESTAARRSGELFGHPTCLFTLFFTEFWERFSFYGMKALLIFYMTYYLFWTQQEASNVFAWYSLVYATPILGGLVADKWIGARWSVVVGGVIIAIGHFLLAFEPLPFFYSGLGCLVVGTGFLKPNISTQVGALYRQSDTRRDSAFTIFYMGINLGALAGPLVCGALKEAYGFHYGFAAAGIGMVVGLILYIFGMKHVVKREQMIKAEEEAAGSTSEPEELADKASRPSTVEESTGGVGTGGPVNAVPMSRIYRDRMLVLVVICVFAILFWVGFEQAANVMNLWADQHTNLHVFDAQAPEVVLPDIAPAAAEAAGETADQGAAGGWRMSATWTQSINPLFIITLAAVFAWLWQYLDRRGMQPSTPMKMALGFFFLACAYAMLIMAAQVENKDTSVQLTTLPAGLDADAEGKVYSADIDEDTGEDSRTYYGATRLAFKAEPAKGGTLTMNGVLNDLDWMRALGASASPEFKEVMEEFFDQVATKVEEVRLQVRAGELPKDTKWEVKTTIADGVDFLPIAGLPVHEEGRDEVRVGSWDPDTRTLAVTAELSERDKAQLLAAGANEQFRDAITQIYQQSSVLKISILWLLAFYMVLTIGELCLSPVGLSLVTKAAPPKYVGLFMGLWFFTTGFIANFVAHKVGGQWGNMTPTSYFMIFGVTGLVAAVLMLMMIRVLKPKLHGVH
jgi:POT family proton-dependent oligopeptide transporter